MQPGKNILHGPQFVLQDSECMGRMIFSRLKNHGSNVAQIDAYTGEEQTFEQILNISVKLAVCLKKKGVKPNDRIAVCSENNLEFCLPVCAALFLGGTVCPLNPIYSDRELEHSLNISKPKVIFVSPIALNVIQEVASRLSWSPIVVLLRNIVDMELPSIENLVSKLTPNEMNLFEPCDVDINQHVASILCSSGTTGLPKGVMLTDRNVLTVIQHHMASAINFMGKNNVILGLLPFFHAYSFTILLLTLISGSKLVILPRFDEEVFLYVIQKYRIENLTLVPPLMTFLAKHPLVDKYDLSSVKQIWCGAAPLSEVLQKAVAKRLNVTNIKQGYGLTETTLAVLRTPDDCNKYGSVGVLAPGVSAKVVPADDAVTDSVNREPLGPNCPGELCFKGDLIMKGYCDDKASTSATIDQDGWLHTGDIGYYDNDGYFYIIDRKKELIKYKGFQVPPAELEAILLSYPGIKDAAVIGKPDEEAGELPVAFVVKQENYKNVSLEDVMNFVNARVSNPKRLRGGIKFVDEIPKSPSGKILRRLLRDSLKSKL